MKKPIQPFTAITVSHRLTLLLATAGSASAAVVNVHPSWERWDPGNGETNQYAIYAHWEFGQNTNPVGPDNEGVIDLNPIHCTLCTNEVAVPTPNATWNPGSDGSGRWDFNIRGQMDGQLTNVIDDYPWKEVQAAITWFGALENAPTFVITSAFDPAVPNNGLIPIDGGTVDNYNSSGSHRLVNDFGTPDPSDDQWVGIYNSRITPNPNNEKFSIFMAPNTGIDGFTIDTISYIPEPGNAMLLGLLSCSGLLLRSRRT